MDQATKSIAEAVIDRVRFDHIHQAQSPIGRVRVRFGNDETERTLWIMRKERTPDHQVHRDITGHIQAVSGSNLTRPTYPDGIEVFRDTPIGRIITDLLGIHTYNAPGGQTRVESYSKASFTNTAFHGAVDAVNVRIELGEAESRFTSLLEALRRISNYQNREQDLNRQLENEQIEERARQIQQELASNRVQLADEIRSLARFRNEELKLRDQPVLDAAQEGVKRANLLNGGLIISGAPGTGKTTSLIQRIAFLTARTLKESVTHLGPNDEYLLFESAQNWQFFSPSELLRDYLKDAMQKESLSTGGDRVDTWTNVRKNLLRTYGWIGSDTAPFQFSKESSFFKPGHRQLADLRALFTEFIIEIQQRNLKSAFEVNSQETGYEQIDRLREVCRAYQGFTKLDQYLQLYIVLQRDFQPLTTQVRRQYREQIDKITARIQAKVQYDTAAYQRVMAYLSELNADKRSDIRSDSEDDDELDSALDEVTESAHIPDAEPPVEQLNRLLIRLCRDLSLKKAPSDLPKSLRGLLNLVDSYIDRAELDKISPASLYLKTYASLTNGPEFTILNKLPSLYKQFRREFLSDSVLPSQQESLNQSIKERNRKLHTDEFDFLLWSLHDLIRDLFRLSQPVYQQSQHGVIAGFRSRVRAVIAIDEAADFSAVQLQAMASLSHPNYNCVTLCGDLMQRLTGSGITSWDDFSQLWPNTEVRYLQRAYRQTPVLLNIARRMYQEIIGTEAPFTSYTQPDIRYARPLFHQNDDAEAMLDWVIERILDINRGVEGRYPTVAIFVEDDQKVSDVYSILRDNETLINLGFEADPCYKGRILGDRQAVRIFSVEYIKGMEFEAVFILNADQLDTDLLNQYLYVGLTRANFYLAMTAQHAFPATISYLRPEFDDQGHWQ